MTKRKIIIKVCKICGAKFEAMTANAKHCPKCRTLKIKSQNPKPLRTVIAELEAYNKENKKLLSYGQFVAFIEGKVKK